MPCLFPKGAPVAKAKAASDPVLGALQQAVAKLPTVLELVGAKGKGLFTKAQKEIADGAVSNGLFRTHTVTGKKKTDTKVYAIITEAGARKLAESGSSAETRQTLEALKGVLERMGGNQGAPDATAFRTALDSATATCVQAINAAFADLRQAVLATVSQPATSTDTAPVLSALTAALGRLNVGAKPVEYPEISKLLAPPPVAPPAPPVVPAAPSTDPARVADAIVEFVTNWARAHQFGPPFDAIMKHLRGLFPAVTIGDFHDTLRRLVSANPPRLKLSTWSQTIHDLPEPELAILLKHTVIYNAHPVA
jgi:hypothetical protein